MNREGMAVCHEEENEMELELDAAQVLANLADSHPIGSKEEKKTSAQEEHPHRFQAKIGEDSKEGTRASHQNQTVNKVGPSTSANQADISSLRRQKNLDVAERDAKRLNRILANRESARQTILRRQAYRDELARKVSILSAENSDLKKEKEHATREYLYQKEMNQQLKEQMLQVTRPSPTLSIPGSATSYWHAGTESGIGNLNSQHELLPTQFTTPACATSNDSPRKTSQVSCSLTLSTGKMKEEEPVQKYKQKLNQSEWKEGSTPYVLLGAADLRRRRMNIVRLKQVNKSNVHSL